MSGIEVRATITTEARHDDLLRTLLNTAGEWDRVAAAHALNGVTAHPALRIAARPLVIRSAECRPSTHRYSGTNNEMTGCGRKAYCAVAVRAPLAQEGT
ncbi:hypothetical protein GCM10023194_30190 [Planotetraspora phitsanulokensis]|uniref:Uncharacterized protein n=1 Tax=Planotetraspora phitsanulokensis TaxID=575192 RepID=A0A8J3TZF1_9ACTN|nr:hypothetical protein Pph01_08460 [Planotetraspora phitsanulokensis]